MWSFIYESSSDSAKWYDLIVCVLVEILVDSSFIFAFYQVSVVEIIVEVIVLFLLIVEITELYLYIVQFLGKTFSFERILFCF